MSSGRGYRSKRRPSRMNRFRYFNFRHSSDSNSPVAATSTTNIESVPHFRDVFKHRGHPPHLKGKQIGLYYRDRYKSSPNDRLPFLPLSYDRQCKIKMLLDNIQFQSDDENFTNVFNSHGEESLFQREYLDIISVPFIEKLDEAMTAPEIFGSMSKGIENRINETLSREHSQKLKDPEFIEMLTFRQKLPAYRHRKIILETIDKNRVVIISGVTGCGKTTQVGQLLLEEAAASGCAATVRILITQPRRIAAISVASRIAAERAEPIGESVGYCIRLESVQARERGCIEVVTAGVVLQRLQSDPALKSVSHLLLDEVHERETISDMLMAILKLILTKRKNLKLILMSATMEIDRLRVYFGNCPVVHIPGFMFPIRELYMEDVLDATQFNNFPHLVVPRDPHARRHEEIQRVEFDSFMTPYVESLRAEGKYSERTLSHLMEPHKERLSCELVAALVQHLCRGPPGAILVFLPGFQDISRTISILQRANLPRHVLLPLHSHLNSMDQRAIFLRPPSGVRKIIVSTNIAETSITIDDVVFVVDCGRMKIQNYDPEQNISTLTPDWVSQANAHQRRGRAGRVQEGEVWRLYTKARLLRLKARPEAEVLRSPLHEPLLASMLLRLVPAPTFLATLLDPPDPVAVVNAVELLTRMEVLDEQQRLTPLGVHVARLPVAPGAARMLLLAALLSATAPATAVAAVTAFKDPFLMPIGKESEVRAVRQRLAGGHGSDQLAAAEAQRRWEALSGEAASRFCHEHFLSQRTMQMLRDMRLQFGSLLYGAHFLAARGPDLPAANRHSNNTSLLKALIVAGLFPNVATCRGRNRRLINTREHGRVIIHPSSVNCDARGPAPHLVYRLCQRSTQIFLHDISPAHTFPLLFFGDNFSVLRVEGVEGTVVSGGGGRWRCSHEAAFLVQRLRAALLVLLQNKLSKPAPVDWDASEGHLLTAIIELITSEDNPDPVSEDSG